MKMILGLLLLVVIPFFANSASRPKELDWSEVRNGGGGIKLTSKFEQLKVFKRFGHIHEMNQTDVPSLKRTAQVIQNLRIPTNLKDAFLRSLVGEKRTYYSAPSFKYFEFRFQEITREYANYYHTSPDKVVIYAITFPAFGKTILFEEFFTLPENEQIKILFHEMLWFLKPSLTYSEIIDIDNSLFEFLTLPIPQTERSFIHYLFLNLYGESQASALDDPSTPLEGQSDKQLFFDFKDCPLHDWLKATYPLNCFNQLVWN